MICGLVFGFKAVMAVMQNCRNAETSLSGGKVSDSQGWGIDVLRLGIPSLSYCLESRLENYLCRWSTDLSSLLAGRISEVVWCAAEE